MKKLALLLAILLAFTSTAQALTFTDADIEHPLFPWGDYLLQISLYTDDGATVGDVTNEAEGTPLLIRLDSLDGTVPLGEVSANLEQFTLRIPGGAELVPVDCRVAGVSFLTEIPASMAENQNSFELIYLLPSGVSAGGTTLVIGEPDANQHIIVEMPAASETAAAPEATAAKTGTSAPAAAAAKVSEAAAAVAAGAEAPTEASTAAPTEEPTAAPTEEPIAAPTAEPTAAPTAEPVAEPSAEPAAKTDEQTLLDQLLAAQAENTKDVWASAILLSGAQDVTLGEEGYTFTLRSYNPDFKALDKESEDYLNLLRQNLTAHNLTLTLLVTTGEDGQPAADKTSMKALTKAVTKAATTTKKGFAAKDMSEALMTMLFGEAITADRFGESCPLTVAQISRTLTYKKGPDELTLSAKFVKTDTLMTKACDAAMLRLSRQGGASALTGNEIAQVLVEELDTQAAALKKKGSSKQSFTFALDALLSGEALTDEAYTAFLGSYHEAFDVQYDALMDAAADMPDYPSEEMPKSGWLSGSKKGTRIIFKIPKDGKARYIQVRTYPDDELTATLFLQPAKSASVRVPKGSYYVLVAIGETWYGETHLFGDDGDYSRTQQIDIGGSKYYYTITLGGVEGGNLSSYTSDPDEFQP